MTPAVRRATGPHRCGRGRNAPHPDYTPGDKRLQAAAERARHVPYVNEAEGEGEATQAEALCQPSGLPAV